MTLENNEDGAPEQQDKQPCSINNSSSIDTVAEDFTNMAALNNTDTTTLSVCAACGKEEDGDNSLKFCGACKLVKYCSAACQKAHRPMHKKECKRRAAELYDEKLFKEIEPEDCPICMLPVISADQTVFHSCCGKNICSGCVYSMKMSDEGRKVICAFCRKLGPRSDEEEINRIKKLMDKGNAMAFNFLGGWYADGEQGVTQDYQKANELFLKAGELGSATGYCNLGHSYLEGRGVEVDMKKAKHYYELAAIGGLLDARNNLGYMEECAGNSHRAMKHYILAARAGYKDSLDTVKRGFMGGVVTKDEYASTLRAYHEIQKEMKSDQRDKAEEFLRMTSS